VTASEEDTSDFQNSIDCVVATGRTCETAACTAWRGPTACDNTVAARCLCSEGTCSSENGVCTNATYVRVGNGARYRIRNARWPYFLDVMDDASLDLSSRRGTESAAQFFLSMPGHGDGADPLPRPLFLIGPAPSLDRAWQVGPGGQVSVEDMSGGSSPQFSITKLGWHLTLTPEGTWTGDGGEPVMLSWAELPNAYLFASEASVVTQGERDRDPGAGGYWFFEPPLPRETVAALLRYSGPACQHDCGEVLRGGEDFLQQQVATAGSTRAAVAGFSRIRWVFIAFWFTVTLASGS